MSRHGSQRAGWRFRRGCNVWSWQVFEEELGFDERLFVGYHDFGLNFLAGPKIVSRIGVPFAPSAEQSGCDIADPWVSIVLGTPGGDEATKSSPQLGILVIGRCDFGGRKGGRVGVQVAMNGEALIDQKLGIPSFFPGYSRKMRTTA